MFEINKNKIFKPRKSDEKKYAIINFLYNNVDNTHFTEFLVLLCFSKNTIMMTIQKSAASSLLFKIIGVPFDILVINRFDKVTTYLYGARYPAARASLSVKNH